MLGGTSLCVTLLILACVRLRRPKYFNLSIV